MAQLYTKYDFYPDDNKVEIHGLWQLSRIMVIANATSNELIYNFAADSLGVESHEIDHDREVTVLELTKDCSAMNEDDVLQIMLSLDFTYMKPEEALMDPVHKMRVSTPENLIDTDFEYGLQPTKWETLETLNNVPSFFISEGDTPLTTISSISAINNSNVITVVCREPHGLSVGTPIDVQGLTSRTAEGKFLISSVTDDEFVYKASGTQRVTGEIGSIYTTITPGTFFTGSEIGFNPTTGLSTDAAAESQITVTTRTPHGFQQKNQFYLVNTLGTKELTIDVANTQVDAADGRPIVDVENNISEVSTATPGLTETKAMRARHHIKFNAASVNIDADTIAWPSHGLRDNDCVLYAPPSGEEEIGGLGRYKVYWVQTDGTDRIKLRGSYNGSAINLTSTGGYDSGRAGLHLVYEIYRWYVRYNDLYTDAFSRYYQTGTGSGWDLYTTYNGARGLGSGSNIRYLVIDRKDGGSQYVWYGTSYPNGVPNNSYGPPPWSEYNFDGYGSYRNYDETNGENIGNDGLDPSIYNPIEDFTKWEPFSWSRNNRPQAGWFQLYKYRYIGTYDRYEYNGEKIYVIPLVEDEEADSLYVTNHGLETGDSVTISYDSGDGSGEQEYTTPGEYNWTVPTGVTSVSVLAIGGGGGGHQYNNYSTGGGGAGLAYKNNITVTPGETIPIFVGEGGDRPGYTSSYNNNAFGQFSVFNTDAEPITDLAGNFTTWNLSDNNYGKRYTGNPSKNHIGRGVSTIELSRTDATNRPTDDGSSLAFFFKDLHEGQPYQYTDWPSRIAIQGAGTTTDDFTMECWVWCSDTYNTYAHVMGWISSQGSIWLRNNGAVYFRAQNTTVTNTASSIWNTNQWHHIAVTRQLGTVRIFVDGTERATNNNYTSQIGSGSYFTIGKDSANGTSYNARNLYVYRPHWARGTGSCKYAAGFTPISNYGTTTGTRFLLTVNPTGKHVHAGGGQAGYRMPTSSDYYNAVGGGGFGLGGGKGGTSDYAGSYASGGGGASGYTGFGGRSGTSTYVNGSNATGGGGGGGGNGGSSDAAGNGGGVGIYGEGTSGLGGSGSSSNAYNGQGGSGGEDGGRGYNQTQGSSSYVNKGGDFGGGGGGADNSSNENGAGGGGAIRIVWPGDTRQFPSTNVENRNAGLTESNHTSAWSSTVKESNIAGSYTVEVINENRFKLDSTRLFKGTGNDITITLNKSNPTGNSFYLAGHGLTTGEEVRFTLGNGGTLPTADTGSVTPNPTPNQSTDSTVKYFEIINDYVNSTLTALSTNDIVTANHNGNSTRVFDTGQSDNTSPIDYYDLQYTTNSVYYSNYGNYNIPNSNFYVGDLSSTRPLNILRGTPLEDRNNIMVATDWTGNSTLKYYLWLRQSDYQSSETFRQYFRDGFNFDNSPSYIVQTTGDNNNAYTATSGNTYRWAGAWFRHNEQNNEHCIYIKLQFWKHTGTDSWTNNGTNVALRTQQSPSSYWYSYDAGYQYKDLLELGLVFFPQTGETDLNTNAEFITFIEGLLDDFDANLTKPDLTDNTVYKVEALTNNRLALSKGGVIVDLTDEGVSPFIFKTENAIGVVDGVYEATSVTSDRINIQTDVKVEGATAIVDTTTISDDTLQVADSGSHTFIPGTAVTYDSNGQGIIGGLEDGATYYVDVVDDQYFRLAETAEDAALGINPISLTANTGGDQNFSTTNIAGIIEAVGTVDVEVNKSKIEGTETIFKRYFKVGDEVYIKNNATSPGSLESFTITSIADDTVMTVDRPITFTASDTKYFVSTKVYVRPDGFAIHRPFDGGVEIAAGTSPLSQIRRQTRKYFRYQSGKGIQTSLAINFNPPITIERLSSAVDSDITNTLQTALENEIGGTTSATEKGAIYHDVAIGTNYGAVTTGLEQLYESSIKENFKSSIALAEERVLTLSSVSGDSNSLENANNHFNVINDILTNGEDNANTDVSFPEPTSSGSAAELTAEIAVKDKLILNKTFIIEELKAYGESIFTSPGWTESDIDQRLEYLVNALIFDGMYGSNNGTEGNSASWDFALFLKDITSTEFKNIHVAMMTRLEEIVADIVQGVSVTATSGNEETANTAGDNARSTEGAEIEANAAIMKNVMRFGEAHLDGSGDAETLTITADDSSAYIIDGMDQMNLTLVRGVTYTFNVQAPGHPFWIKTSNTTGDSADIYSTGVTNNGDDEGQVEFTVPSGAPDTLYYQCENHQAMGGELNIVDSLSRTVAPITWTPSASQTAANAIKDNAADIVAFSIVDTYIATVVTKYPHRLSEDLEIKIKDASDSTYNGLYGIESIEDDFTFKYVLPSAPATSSPTGIIKYTLGDYSGASLRSGMFDDQNGFFMEYDGTNVNCVRRTSTAQLSGSVSILKGSGEVTGDNSTQFQGQLQAGDKIVLRGQTYVITEIASNNKLYIQPAYRGASASGIIVTKTEDIRVPQSEWSLDKCDGTGPSGFKLDTTKIQMTYSDYSWYGAGKIRFGFKNQDGHVIYVHEFVHNNRLDESYMRSGNVPARYEIENGVNPQYAPTLFHWGTSVIMDGTFDDDKAYLFTAASESLTFTNGDSATVNTTGSSSLRGFYNRNARAYDWYVRIPFSTNDATKFYNGLPLYTTDESLNGETVSFTQYSGSTFYVYIYIQRSYNQPSVYPSVGGSVAVSLAVPSSGATDADVNLGTDIIPLVSFRLAPSVDNNLSGNLGERDIINRMQLKLKEAGVIITHDCEVKLILNGDLSSVAWEGVPTPSLSQLIKHPAGDTITGGTELFTFRAAGGTVDSSGKRSTNDTSLALTEIIDMGNSILGGDGTFPNGPDVLTVAVQVTDTNDIDAGNPFIASARINWAESQA